MDSRSGERTGEVEPNADKHCKESHQCEYGFDGKEMNHGRRYRSVGEPSEREVSNLEHLFRELASQTVVPSPIMVCLYTGHLPQFASPMGRDPYPPVGQALDDSFLGALHDATTVNPAIHDGAVMAKWDASGRYRVTGWSYRLFPPDPQCAPFSNRGSAFNSCLAMSEVEGVEGLYLVTKGQCWRFKSGHGSVLPP
jgi:hypothetical protein